MIIAFYVFELFGRVGRTPPEDGRDGDGTGPCGLKCGGGFSFRLSLQLEDFSVNQPDGGGGGQWY
jgi:hypothetical protein